MRTLQELINTTEPGWPVVKELIAAANNKVEILPCNRAAADSALYQTQVTTRSPMGAIVHESGGLLIDNGWIRILGSGHPRLSRSLPGWNNAKAPATNGIPGFMLVADDAIGGFFAINHNALGSDSGKIYYLAPDNLEWEALDLSYTDFLVFCFSGNLEEFYANLRWENWQEGVAALNGDLVYNFFPTLWTAEGKDINKNSRRAIPVEEQFELNMSFRKRLGLQ
ncbi:DUF2625 domain-containing protein [Chitinophaga lutea]|uniref:DUF2625 domain-containing protein n=1 Tax=Chitinophaga lutea TaxID=2488634 RepID=A0A3N4Q2D2_9BACT|nr:DUF2625 domain-containing protein [Chitinophaga lutea]RPE13735.1 DUF2625 domain-containing protein [Chitinophaga lutea]